MASFPLVSATHMQFDNRFEKRHQQRPTPPRPRGGGSLFLASDDRLPTGGPARCWDAGTDGRAVLDRICEGAPGLLRPGGVLLVVFSALSGVDQTLDQLTEAGLDASVVARTIEPFGPVMTSRAALLEARGVIAPGQREEELVVVRGQSPG